MAAMVWPSPRSAEVSSLRPTSLRAPPEVSWWIVVWNVPRYLPIAVTLFDIRSENRVGVKRIPSARNIPVGTTLDAGRRAASTRTLPMPGLSRRLTVAPVCFL